MKKLSLGLVALSVCAVAHQTEKSNLGIFAETKLTRIAGMKPVKLPKLPFGVKIPQAAQSMISGAPTRGLTVKLWSPNVAPDNATASLAIPSGLNLGDKLDLDIYRPTAPTAPPTGGSQSTNSTPQDKPDDFTIKIYWGSSPTVKDGQPKVFTLANLTAEGRSMMMNRMASARQGAASYIYKSSGSTAVWPTPSAAPEIKTESSLVGTYTLNSSYAGTSTIEAPSNVDFLAPIEITSPDLAQKVPIDGPLAFQWNPIPNCLGQFASAFGIEGRNTLVLWTSSENYGDQIAGDMGFLQMEAVKGYVDQHLLMSGDSTAVTIPAGIFKDCSVAIYNMIGYGPGAANDGSSPVARIQTKTDLTVMLLGAGKGFGNRGGEQK